MVVADEIAARRACTAVTAEELPSAAAAAAVGAVAESLEQALLGLELVDRFAAADQTADAHLVLLSVGILRDNFGDAGGAAGGTPSTASDRPAGSRRRGARRACWRRSR